MTEHLEFSRGGEPEQGERVLPHHQGGVQRNLVAGVRLGHASARDFYAHAQAAEAHYCPSGARCENRSTNRCNHIPTLECRRRRGGPPHRAFEQKYE
ncbi:hypothetical protein GCM10009805_13330 [Leucobacter chromiireducens subsp. solipictus]